MNEQLKVAIVGAGPYGLSVAAHLRAHRVPFRIFGKPMQVWHEQMPDGMFLKSDGFASNISDPSSSFTLQHYCQEKGIEYDHRKIPVHLDTFRSYGLAFKERMVPEAEDTEVRKITRGTNGFRLDLSSGETVEASHVVIAVGISYFQYIPPSLANLPAGFLSHSSAHKDPSRLRGRDVAVIGAGASAIDLAVLLQESGANVTLIARRPSLTFHDRPAPRRSFWQRINAPSSPIGPGWRSWWFCTVPGLFRLLPEKIRLHIVRTHAGPSAGWPMKDRFQGKVRSRVGCEIQKAEIRDGRVFLALTEAGQKKEYSYDHVVAATGYRVDLRRLPFLDKEILAQLRSVENAPVLSGDFQSSLSGMYFVGVASANTFGPIMRFACGADWAATNISRTLAQQVSGN